MLLMFFDKQYVAARGFVALTMTLLCVIFNVTTLHYIILHFCMIVMVSITI